METNAYKPTRPVIPASGCLLLAIFCLAGMIEADSAGAVTDGTWKSLSGDFKRTGLSENSGPELGCVKWKFETTAPISASVAVGPAGRIHVGCEDGKLYTLDANGSLIWTYDANSPFLSSPSSGLNGNIYVGSKNGKLHAIDADGNLLWTHTTDGPIYSSPAVSKNGTVYVGSQDGKLHALGKDGSELWSFETKGPGVVASGSIFASPAIGADGTVYIAGLYDPNLYALDPETGNVKWQCSFESGGWPFASPVIAPDGTIYQTLLYDSKLYAIEPSKGTIIWSTDLADPCSAWFDPDADGWSEPALGPDGTIYVSLDDPYLRALDPNGTIKWVTRLGLTGGSTLTVGRDGLIYTASDDGYLCVVDANGWEISRFKSDDWLNFPVIPTDNMLIVSDAQDTSLLIHSTSNTVWVIGREGCETRAFDLHWIADLEADGDVDFADLALLAADWLSCTADPWICDYFEDELYLQADTNRDQYVNLADLTVLAEQWLTQEW